MDLVSKTAKISQRATIIEPVRINDDVQVSDKVTIGKYTVLGKRANIGPFSSIGNYCIIDHDCDIAAATYPTNYLSTHTFQYNKHHFGQIAQYADIPKLNWVDNAETIIGHDVRIGPQTTICRGVKIGTGAIISPNTLITKDVPPYAIVEGNPSMIVGYRFDESIIKRLLDSQWWNFNPTDIVGIDFSDIQSALNEIFNLKLHYQLRNETLLKNSLSNNASLSKTGIIWFSTPYSHIDTKILNKYKVLTITSINNNSTTCIDLQIGEYKISEGSYDSIRGWYKIKFFVDDAEYSDKLHKNSLNFTLS